MNKFKFVYKKELVNIVTMLFCFFLLGIFESLLFDSFYFFAIMLALCVYVIVWNFNIFCQYKITESGVENRVIQLRWEDIREYKVFYETRIRFGIKKVYPPFLCLGEICEGGFFEQKRTKCVFIPLTQYNLQYIKNYCTVENEAITELLNEHLKKQ